MKEYQTKDLLPGMVTAIPVRTKRGQLIINPNVELTRTLISRLEFYGIASVQITENKQVATPMETPKDPAYFPAKSPVSAVHFLGYLHLYSSGYFHSRLVS